MRFHPAEPFIRADFKTYMSFNSIRTISFDATGTLFDPFPSIGAIYSEVLQNHGVFMTEPELEMRFMAEFHKSRMHSPGTINESVERERWTEVVQAILGNEYQDALFEMLWKTMGEGYRWKPKPRLKRTLQALKDEGFRLIIVSNWDQRLYGILENLKLRDFFDGVFISTELGMEKPSVSIYHKVAELLGATPSSLLHLGNSMSNDFTPSLRAGWNSLLLHNRIPHGMEPGTVLGSIDQLPEVLKSEQANHST
ncbi:MAG: HAD-IA family hydrolase [Verrucomicrobia bacterium]|nr:HAD-IA family hydrolase [Verrucomicrobiota bacterium]